MVFYQRVIKKTKMLISVVKNEFFYYPESTACLKCMYIGMHTHTHRIVCFFKIDLYMNVSYKHSGCGNNKGKTIQFRRRLGQL